MIIFADTTTLDIEEAALARMLEDLHAEARILKAQENVLRGFVEVGALPDDMLEYLAEEYNVRREAWQAKYDVCSDLTLRLHPERFPKLGD